MPFATRAGGGLFGKPPNILATRFRAELEALAGGLEMQPFKVVMKVKMKPVKMILMFRLMIVVMMIVMVTQMVTLI